MRVLPPMTNRAFLLLGLAPAIVACHPFVPLKSAPGFAAVPFTTVLDDGVGEGWVRAAGGSERTILASDAEWDAFLARHQAAWHPRSPVLAPGFGRPNFEALRVVALVDGDVPVGATSRIVAVDELPDRLEVRTRRWVPTAGPADAQARVHLIVLPRGPKPIAFAPHQVVAEAPRWQAVPNPLVTRERVASMARSLGGAAADAAVDVEKSTYQEALRTFPEIPPDAWHHTWESEVWIARVAGTTAELLVDVETGHEHIRRGVPSPVVDLNVEVQAKGGYYVGEALTLALTGPAPESAITLGVAGPEPGQVVEKVVPADAIAGFTLPLTPAALPWLDDAPVHPLRITLTNAGGTRGFGATLLRPGDRDAKPMPPLRVAGPGENPHAFGPAPAFEALEAFAMDIAERDWAGQGVTLRSTRIGVADVPSDAPRRDAIPADVALHRFELPGRYPKYVIDGVASGTGKPTVLSPTRLIVVLVASTPIQVLSIKADAP